MVLFYTEKIEDNLAYFLEEECRHINNALRKSTGDTIHFIDGKGILYKGKIQDISKRKAIVRITEKQKQKDIYPYVHIAIAPTKNMDRIEWFLEKAIEIGVNEISFILCKHSEKKQFKMERMKRIMIASCKQSMKATFPILNELQRFEEWISIQDFQGQSLIACLTENTKAIAKAYQKQSNVRICIGPEGGFRESEIEAAIENGFQAVSLGEQRLRTETAGLFAVANVRILNT